MKRLIVLVLFVTVFVAGCGDEKKDETKDPPLPPAKDMFDKTKPAADPLGGGGKKSAGKFD